jgi:uncharacterized protein YqgC (DUF456 family)
MLLTAGILVTIGALIGVLLTAVTLPGIWIMLLIAMVCTWWQPSLFSLWTLGAVAAIAVLAEVAEALSSAAGSARTGGSRAGIAGSLVGSIIGGIVGAGLGASIAERGIAKRTWGESLRSGRGAAVGRALSTVVKTVFAIGAALVLIVGAFAN